MGTCAKVSDLYTFRPPAHDVIAPRARWPLAPAFATRPPHAPRAHHSLDIRRVVPVDKRVRVDALEDVGLGAQEYGEVGRVAVERVVDVPLRRLLEVVVPEVETDRAGGDGAKEAHTERVLAVGVLCW